MPPPLHQVTLRPGTQVSVRLIQTLSTVRPVAGDTFVATLAQPVIVDGLVIAEKGARASGRVVESRKAGRFSGTSLLELTLASLYTADGQRIAVSTSPWSKQNASQTGGDAAKSGRRCVGCNHRRDCRGWHRCGDRCRGSEAVSA